LFYLHDSYKEPFISNAGMRDFVRRRREKEEEKRDVE
jgi:hypothetical protein